jgi:glycerol-3-phosphate dehydrogenase (NAD(P)+)
MVVTVLGAGSWGTALGILLARNGHKVTIVGRNLVELDEMRQTHRNSHYLPDFDIPESVALMSYSDVGIDTDMTVVAVPSSGVRQIVAATQGHHPLVVVASKGLETDSSKTMCQVVSEVLPSAEVGVLSGPNLAVEIARGVPTVAVAAFSGSAAAETVRDAFMCRTFRVSTSTDVKGVELAGALKNVLAIGAGMSDGLGFGDNTKGAFLSRGLMEMARLGLAMGATMETFLGPAGVGDLFATAASTLSRNYRIGRALGEGHPLQAALSQLGQVAEGVPTSHAAGALAIRHNVDMPVFAAVEAVLTGRVEPIRAVGMLMERSSKMGDFLQPGS